MATLRVITQLMSLLLSYSRVLKEGFSIGLTLKFIQQKIANELATGWRVDFGGLYNLEKTLFGICIQNIGLAIGF